MDRRQLVALLACNLCVMTIGSGVLPMLPGYAAELGASQTVVGLYLAMCYTAVAAGALSAAWLGRTLGGYGRVLSISGAIAVPATLAIGFASNIWTLTAFTSTLWFMGGLGLALVSILAGLSAGPDERGKVFGILALTGPGGSLLGGLVAGPMVERWGYAVMFASMAAVAVLWLVASRTVPEVERQPGRGAARTERGAAETRALRFGRRFYLLFAAQILFAISGFVGVPGRLLVMGEMGFSATAISLTGAVTGAITLPISPLAGVLSDRIGRRLLLAIGYALGLVGVLVLLVCTVPWHFGVSATFLGASMSLGGAVSSAFAADLLPRQSVDRGMSLISATGWIGAIVGMAGTGYTLEHFGSAATFAGGAILPLVSIVLLYLIRVSAPSTAAAES